MSSGCELVYFDLRGRAEAIRLTLHYLNVPFSDRKILSPEEWRQERSQTPFRRLPALKKNGLTVYESHAILRFLGRDYGFYSGNETRDTLLDTTQEYLSEAQESLWKLSWQDDFLAGDLAYANETILPYLLGLQHWVGEHFEPFIAGDSPTHIDFLIFTYLDEIDAFFPLIWKRLPLLKAYYDRLQRLERLQLYFSSDQRPIVFGMCLRGPKVDRRKPIPDGAVFRNPWREDLKLDAFDG